MISRSVTGGYLNSLFRGGARPAAAITSTLLLLSAGVGLARTSGPAGAAAITVALPKASAPAFAGSAEAQDMHSSAATASLVNAALPFSTAPLQSAEPFVISGSDVDKELALRCLTQAVYYEAGYEPVEGRRAVAQVVLNRVRHPAFPKSVCGVVYQGAGSGSCQFTFVCNGRLSKPPSLGVWREAEAVARAALSGYVADEVGEATHYHADYVAPQLAPMLAKVAAIGQHIFYRWPGEWGAAAMFSGRYAGEPRDALTLRLAQSTGELKGVARTPQADAPGTGPRVQYDIAALLGSAPAGPADTAQATTAAAAAISAKGPDARSIALKQ